MKCGQCGFESEQEFTYCPACGTKATGGDQGGLAGRILNGKYRVVSELGAGSMGTVYLAEHVALKKRIALKVLHRELQLGDEAIQRFQREGIAAGQITHANVIQIFDFDRTDSGTAFLAMEYVEGENLKELLARESALPTETALEIVRQLLHTLAEAHRHGVVHRDLKPENLMVVRGADDTLTLKVLDFGLSKLVDRRFDASLQTMSGRVMGTPLYMAPEQWHGEEVDARSDLYSVALILYELLTGHQPFKSSNVTEMLLRSTTEAPPSVLDHATKHPVPVDLDPILRKGLAKARDERYQSAAEMLEDLDDVRLDQVQRGSRPSRRRAPAGRGRRRSEPQAAPAGRQKLYLGGGAIVAVGAVLFWAFGLDGSGGGGQGDARLVSEIPAERRSDGQQEYIGFLDEARDRLRGGNLVAAMAAADKAVRHQHADAEALVVRANVYERQRDFETAMLDYKDAESRLPGFAPAIAGIGWLLFQRDQLQEADARFRSAMAEDASCGSALAGAAAVLLRTDRATEALQLLDAQGEDVASDPLVLVFRGQAQLASDDTAAALDTFRQAKRADPSQWRAYHGLARAYERSGDLEAAERQCTAGLAMAKQETALLMLHAELLLAQERFGEALTTLAGQGKTDGDVLLLRGLAHQGLGNGEQALAAWRDAIDHDVEEPAVVHLLQAMQHATDEQWDACRQAAQEAARLDDSMAKGFFYEGLASFRLDDIPAAASSLEQAVALDSRDLVARRMLGVLYMDYLDQPTEAVTHFKAYVAGGGDDPRVGEWIRKLGG